MIESVWSMVFDRRFWAGPAPRVILVLVLVNIGVCHWRIGLAQERRKNLAAGDLGAFTANGRCDTSYGQATLSTWDAIPDATKQPVVILCGTSQQFVINERQPGDHSVCDELNDRLAPSGIAVYGLAAPNLCNEEALLLLTALLQRPQTTPGAFIYGATFGKMRRAGLRPGYRTFLKAQPQVQAAWKELADNYRQVYRLATDQMGNTLADIQAPDREKAITFEGQMRKGVAAYVPVVAARHELNGFLQQKLYLVRDNLLGIRPASKRPMMGARYDGNRELLEIIMDRCQKAGVRFIPYVVPLHPLEENPYVLQEYADFKHWLGKVTRARGIRFLDLEQLVPADEWGEPKPEHDYEHFTAAGHRRLAAKLAEAIALSPSTWYTRE